MSNHDPASDPPGAVSDQNREEAESEHRGDQKHPEPRTTGAPARKAGKDEKSSGAAGEGSQSTGHPDNAG